MILTLNAGSSTIKFAAFAATSLERSLIGAIDRIGTPHAVLSWRAPGIGADPGHLDVPSGTSAAAFLLDWLADRAEGQHLAAVGHRVVHGLMRTEPARLTPEIVDELRRATAYAPDHLPREIALIDAVAHRHADLPQVACFDTAFHRQLPRLARLLPLPRRYQQSGLQRYGFHGLSYGYLLEELARVAGREAADGRVIFAHLGHGASLAAVHHGRPVDTSMGFTPASGLVMSSRTGDLDPGVVAFLAATEGMTPQQFHALVNHESGLVGLSESSGDMRDLLDRERDDERAAEAIALFCYQATKWIGAFAAALGGLETLVFSAGVGTGSAAIRARITAGLAFLGVELDDARNAAPEAVISTAASRVTVRVMPTDEELMIARLVTRVLDLARPQGKSDQ